MEKRLRCDENSFIYLLKFADARIRLQSDKSFHQTAGFIHSAKMSQRGNFAA